MRNVSPSVFEDCCTLGQGLSNRHGESAILLAGLHTMCESLFAAAGTQWAVDVEPIRKEFHQCIKARMVATGMPERAFEDALSGLREAGRTAAYIAAIPE